MARIIRIADIGASSTYTLADDGRFDMVDTGGCIDVLGTDGSEYVGMDDESIECAVFDSWMVDYDGDACENCLTVRVSEGTTVRVDYENAGEAFWPALRERAYSAPLSALARKALSRLAFGSDEAIVPADEADEVEAWLATLPGWEGGAEYAPHPVLFQA